jgi:hypothetical protein
LKTFFGAINNDVISQMAISKSICGNLKSLVQISTRQWTYAGESAHLLKNLGIRKLDPPRPDDADPEPPTKLPALLCCRGTDM